MHLDISLAEMLRIKQAIKRWFTVPPQITCASALPGKIGKHENCILHSNAVLVHCQNSLLDYFSLFDSWLILKLPYESLNFVINAFSSGLFRGMVQDKGSRGRCSSWTVLYAQCMCTNALSLWKKKVTCLIASNICWDSKISHWYCSLTFSPGLSKNNSHFYSAPQCIASAVLATAIPSVCPSVCPSHAGIVSKRRHVARCSLHRCIAKCV